jgi:predicted enzyme related to lactoylglutathione lyase
MLQKLRTIIYHVKDLAKAKEWYIQLTGIKPYFDEVFYVGFDINGYELGLDPDLTNVKEGNHSVAYWSVEDIDSALEKAVELKAKIITPATNVGGSIFTAVVEDPSGNYIGFIKGA